MALRIELKQFDLDSPDAQSELLQQASTLVAENDDRELVVDLCDINTIRSDQLNKLIALHGHVRGHGRTLVLSGVQDQLMQVFQLTRLDRLFEIQGSGVA